MRLVGICFIAYGLTYCANSLSGGYWLLPDLDGAVSYAPSRSGMGLPVALLWQPRFGYSSNSRRDFLGYSFLPLIKMDRFLFHKTLYLSDEPTLVFIDTKLPPGLVHPHFRERFARQRGLPVGE